MITQAVFDTVVSVTSPLLSIILFSSLAILLLWRLWAFTVLPALYPDDPKELPYWMPGKLNFNQIKFMIQGADQSIF